MNFPTDEEIDNLETGDIVIFPISEKGCLLNGALISEGEIFFSSRWFFLGQDSDNYLICLYISSEVIINFSVGPFDNFLDNKDKIRFTKILNKIPIKDLNGIDIHQSTFFDKSRVIGIEKKIIKLPEPVGMNCCECNEYYHYAIPNLSNGNLACWSCRDSYKWKYSELYIGGK